LHAEFLSLYPVIARHARIAFRDRPAADRDEAEAEAVAAAYESFLSLKARGQDPAREFPTLMATFAVLHLKNERHVGGRSSSKDVLSPRAQKCHGFTVERLPSAHATPYEYRYGDPHGQQAQDAFEERLQDNHRSPVPDQVCFRLDFPAFL